MECTLCPEIQKLAYDLRHTNLELSNINQISINRDVEHEATIQGVATRMDTLQTQFEELRQDVKQDIRSVKEAIPAMFEHSINALMARVAKWLIIGIVTIVVTILLIVALALTRPMLIQSLEELKTHVQSVEVPK